MQSNGVKPWLSAANCLRQNLCNSIVLQVLPERHVTHRTVTKWLAPSLLHPFVLPGPSKFSHNHIYLKPISLSLSNQLNLKWICQTKWVHQCQLTATLTATTTAAIAAVTLLTSIHLVVITLDPKKPFLLKTRLYTIVFWEWNLSIKLFIIILSAPIIFSHFHFVSYWNDYYYYFLMFLCFCSYDAHGLRTCVEGVLLVSSLPSFNSFP